MSPFLNMRLVVIRLGQVVFTLAMVLGSATNANFLWKERVGEMTIDEAFPDVSVRHLVEAARAGNERDLKDLIGRGADVNAVGTKGITPLIWCYLAHDRRGMELLLHAGANPNYREPTKNVSVLSLVIRDEDFKALELLLKNHAAPNLEAPYGKHLIHLAVIARKLDAFLLLLEHGADVNLIDSDGKTAANHAVYLGRFELVSMMLERGLTHDLQSLADDVEIRNVRGLPEAEKWKATVTAMLSERGAVSTIRKPRATAR